LCVPVRSLLLLFVIALFFPATLGCRRETPPPPAIRTGEIRSENASYSVVFFYPAEPKARPEFVAENLVRKILPEVNFTKDRENPVDSPFIGFEEEIAPLKQFPVPEPRFLEFAGQGLTAEDLAAIQRSPRATHLILDMNPEHVFTVGRRFTELVLEFADQTGAYILDSATRQLFSREAWKRRRLDTWPEGGEPAMESQITIHLHRPSEQSPYLRAVSLGMEKFALPDLVVERLADEEKSQAGQLINLIAQSWAENPDIADGDREVFKVAELQSERVRERYKATGEANAALEAAVALVPGTRQEGDPTNRLVQIDFRHGEGKTPDEKRKSVLLRAFGASDRVKEAEHTPEVLASSARAKARLPDLRQRFNAGLPAGSRLLVKGSFKRSDNNGHEWMWVEVEKWNEGGPIEGTLQNQPLFITGLGAGAKVRVREPDVFDYLLYHSDGKPEGNETGSLIINQDGTVREK
jgi:uncharacterized protein YegJ (DUF2314 family)